MSRKINIKKLNRHSAKMLNATEEKRLSHQFYNMHYSAGKHALPCLGRSHQQYFPKHYYKFITESTILNKLPLRPNENTSYTIKDTETDTIPFYYRKDLNANFKYKGEALPNCDHLKVAAVYEDKQCCLITFTLCDSSDTTIGVSDIYCLYLNKVKSEDTNAIEDFNDFPTFYNLLMKYNAKYLKLYYNKSAIAKDTLFEGMSDIKDIIADSFWKYLMAGTHKEYYKHVDKELGSKQLYYNKDNPYHESNYGVYAGVPARLLTFDQYASTYYDTDTISNALMYFEGAEGLICQLPPVVSMLKHRSKRIEDYIDLVGNGAWRTITHILNRVNQLYYGGRDTSPVTLYNLYYELHTNENPLSLMTKQLYKYVYKKSYLSDRNRVTCTLEEREVNKDSYDLAIKWSSDRYVYSFATVDEVICSLLNDKTRYIGCYDEAEQMIECNTSLIPAKSFNIDEYKEVTRAEYALVSEIKDFMYDGIGYGDERGVDLSQSGFGYFGKHNSIKACTNPWTMAIFNDFEIGFYLSREEVVDSDGEKHFLHHYLSITGVEFTSTLPESPETELERIGVSPKVLCYVTEDNYNDDKFRARYPKLIAMYDRGLRLYHEYAMHGEKNPVAKIILEGGKIYGAKK